MFCLIFFLFFLWLGVKCLTLCVLKKASYLIGYHFRVWKKPWLIVGVKFGYDGLDTSSPRPQKRVTRDSISVEKGKCKCKSYSMILFCHWLKKVFIYY